MPATATSSGTGAISFPRSPILTPACPPRRASVAAAARRLARLRAQAGGAPPPAAVPPHRLDDEGSLVGFGGVADVVDRLDDGVQGGVGADAHVGAAQVVVDRGGDAHDGNPPPGARPRAVLAPVAPDDDNGLPAGLSRST